MPESSPARRALRYLAYALHPRAGDVGLCGFPRSGSTWVRFVVFAALQLDRDGRAGEADFSTLDGLMPELSVTPHRAPWPFAPRRLLKTHRPRSALTRFDAAVLLLRDPRDVLVSHFHYKRDREGEFRGDFSAFIRDPRHGLPAWLRHRNSWREHADLTLHYAALKSNPEREFAPLFDLLEIDADLLTPALPAASRTRVAAADGSSGDASFIREDRAPTSDYFSESDEAWFRRTLETAGGYAP